MYEDYKKRISKLEKAIIRLTRHLNDHLEHDVPEYIRKGRK